MPAQIENWLKIVENKKSPQDLRQNAILHLASIRDIINKSIGTTVKNQGQRKYENMSTR
jgi:hypothetical protein